MVRPTDNPTDRRAPFFVIEGVDGCGKSTQVQLFTEWLHSIGVAVRVTREPGGTALAERLRPLILDAAIPCSPRAELLMLLAARAQHVEEVIVPSLAQGVVVVSDRFSLSSLAYQGFGRGLPLDEIRMANAVATAGVLTTQTILLDVPLPDVLQRIGERDDRFEGEGRHFLQRVIDGYRTLAAEDRSVRRIDGRASVDEVQRCIRQILRPFVAGYCPAGSEES